MNKSYIIAMVLCIYSVACITENNYMLGSSGIGGSNGVGVDTGAGEGGYHSSYTGYVTTNSAGGENSEAANSSSSGEPVCTPRTCADVGAECGELYDGCGNFISCESGKCTHNNGYAACGRERFENGVSLGKNPNLCGGGCLYKNEYKAPINCKEEFPDQDYDHYFWCVPNGTQAVNNFGDCEWVGERVDDSLFGGDWCCEQAPE